MSAGMVDHNALRTHQALLTGALVAAYIAGSPALVAMLALLMLVGTMRGKPGFLPLYSLFVRLGWLVPDLQPDRPEPHRFAHFIGTLFLAGSTAATMLGLHGFAWSLAMVVALLAGLNLFTGFCAGCAGYYWLARLGFPGFRQTLERSGKNPEPEREV